MANPVTLRQLLASTSVPSGLVDELLSDAGTPWLLGATDEVVAAEAVLCHPPLAAGEVRAVANPTDRPGVYRLTVVASDRPGLLAGTAGVLAGEGLSITDASVTVLPASGLALQRVLVAADGAGSLDDEGWQQVGARLRAVLGDRLPVRTEWEPTPPVEVETQPQHLGRVAVTVHAPDRPGLLHAAAAWFEAQGCNVEACHASSADGRAADTFVVAGHVDPRAMAAALSGEPARTDRGGFFPLRLGFDAVKGAVSLPWRVGAAVAGRLPRR